MVIKNSLRRINVRKIPRNDKYMSEDDGKNDK